MMSLRTFAWRQVQSSAWRASCRLLSTPAAAVTANANAVADKCDKHVLKSPYDPIPEGPYPPLYEFVSMNWKPNNDEWKNKVAIVDLSTGQERTLGQIHSAVGGFAASLKYELNVEGPGSCVAMFCPNHVDYLAVSLAVTMTGGCLTPINPLSRANELLPKLESSRATVLMVHPGTMDVALQALASEPDRHCVKQVIVLTEQPESLPEGTVDLQSLCQHDKPIYETSSSVQQQNTKQHVCLLPYSSGTSGQPKGVCLTHENLVANLWQLESIEQSATTPDTIVSSPLPFFHIYALVVNLFFGIAFKGQTLITNSGRFDLEEWCKAVQEHKVNRTYLVPPILLGLAKHPLVQQYDLSSLQTVLSAAAPAGRELEKQVMERIGCNVKQCWGMTELSPLGTGHTDDNIKHGSVGPLAPSTLGKIVDAEGNSLGPHQDGELLIKGPQVMAGYLNEPQKTAETLSDSGWLRTGDVAHHDDDGYFYITDRIKELIKVKGFQVAPAELEALLVTHEAVADAAVIGIPDEESGELPRAFVVLKPGTEATESTPQEIEAWVQERVAPHMRVKGGVVLTDAIPKSASGKILRRMFKEQRQ